MGLPILCLYAAMAMVSNTANTSSFADRLWAAIPQTRNGNRLVSPTSVDIALRMLLFGTAGQTQADLAKGLDVLGRQPAQVAEETQRYLSSLRADPGVTVSNAVFSVSSFSINPDFSQRISTIFGGTAEQLPASSEEAVQYVNNWVSQHTKNRIPKIISKIAPDEALFVVNTITFDGKWLSPFPVRDTKDRTFHGVTLDSEVPMMHMTARLQGDEFNGRKVLILPYQGNQYEMVLVLPREGEDAAKAITTTPVNSLSVPTQRIDVILPRFQFSDSLELATPLKALGMGTMFEHGNFSPMNPRIRNITRVIHETMIKVNEEGTEAAAATGIGGSFGGIGGHVEIMEFHADRPFGFAIVNIKTGEKLFIGVVNKLLGAGTIQS